MWESIINELHKFDIVDWTVLITGLFYAFFSVLNKPICWVFGIISCGLLSFKDFTQYNLYFDGILQILYVLLGFVGIYKWIVQKTEAGLPKIFSLPILSHINALILGVILSAVLVFLMQFFYNPAFAYIDSVTTVFSVWATWLLVNRVYENWYYWLIINLVYIYIYYAQGGALVSLLYVIYFMTSIAGIVAWKKDLKKNQIILSNKELAN